MKFKIKKGDLVSVITGKDKGKSGKVLRVDKKTERVLVEGVNVYKKHVRPKTQQEKGQVIEAARPVHISNVKKISQS
jgi:large subunit ribosomal protein L24